MIVSSRQIKLTRTKELDGREFFIEKKVCMRPKEKKHRGGDTALLRRQDKPAGPFGS